MKIREPVKSVAYLLIGVLIGFGFGIQTRNRLAIPLAIPEVSAAAAVASVKPMPITQSRIPANLLDRKEVCQLAAGERGWVSALHLRIDRDSKVWVNPNATCFKIGYNNVPEGEVVNLLDGLHLYITTEAFAWTTLISSEEPDSDWLAIEKVHDKEVLNERRNKGR